MFWKLIVKIISVRVYLLLNQLAQVSSDNEVVFNSGKATSEVQNGTKKDIET